MALAGGTYGLSFLAGILSTLSPCVLPILPVVLAAAAASHRLGAVALAGGIATSFMVVGLFVATIGFSVGLDTDSFRIGAVILMAAFGVLLLSSALQERVAALASGFGSAKVAAFNPTGAGGQFLLGLLMGTVWSPCVGPTLGAAATLAAQRQRLGEVALTMLVFGLGAVLPLALVGTASREVLTRWRGKLLKTGTVGKRGLAVLLILLAMFIGAGGDRSLEAALVSWSPTWLIDLTTRF